MKVHCLADASPDFQDLISQLLVKNPATRLTWKAMCEHPFWQTPLSQRPMPPEPMLDAFIKRHGLRPVAQPPAAQANGQLEAHVKVAQVEKTKKRNKKTTPFSVNYVRSQVLCRAAQGGPGNTATPVCYEAIQCLSTSSSDPSICSKYICS